MPINDRHPHCLAGQHYGWWGAIASHSKPCPLARVTLTAVYGQDPAAVDVPIDNYIINIMYVINKG